MKITLEIKLPKDLEQLLQHLHQATLVYTEGATSFPPAEPTKASASAPAVEPAAEPAKGTPPSAPALEPSKPRVTLADAKNKILAMPNGHALAMERLKEKGLKKLGDLNSEQLVDFLLELGVAS